MDSKEAVFLIEKLHQTIPTKLNLSDTQEFVLHRCLLGLSYQEIADLSGYDHDYIKQTGAKLWRSLTTVLNRKVTKSNIRNVLNQYCQEQAKNKINGELKSPVSQPESIHDWGDAIDIRYFVGRNAELERCKKWIISDRSRLVTIIGMGGVGKTAMASKLARNIAPEFNYVIWRSLRNAPRCLELIAELIIFISGKPKIKIPHSIDACIALLMQHLSTSRCLLILDNADSILRSGQTGGRYRQGYEGYGQLLRRIADEEHQSCAIVTTREQLIGISQRKGKTSPVSTLQLTGLDLEEGRKVLTDNNIVAEQNTLSSLVELYSGNPLALKIVSATINSLFNGSVNSFLARGSTVFGDIWYLFEQQFNRLTPLEQRIMYWLAIARVPLSISQLSQNLIPKVPQRSLLKVLESLQGRSSIEIYPQGFTQRALVMEYVTEKFIKQVHKEILTQQLDLFITHPLIQSQSSDRVRQTQTCLISQSIIDSLLVTLKTRQNIAEILDRLLEKLQGQSLMEAGYGVENSFNLLCQLDSNFQRQDFCSLFIQQAYLFPTALERTDFSDSNSQQS